MSYVPVSYERRLGVGLLMWNDHYRVCRTFRRSRRPLRLILWHENYRSSVHMMVWVTHTSIIQRHFR